MLPRLELIHFSGNYVILEFIGKGGGNEGCTLFIRNSM